MFKAIKNNKVIAINNIGVFPTLVYDRTEEDKSHNVSDFKQYDGKYLLISEVPIPTNEDIRKHRKEAYKAEVDPITAHIQRLRDDPVLNETRISELILERKEKVKEIKTHYPYSNK